jgi:hypothetical protein
MIFDQNQLPEPTEHEEFQEEFELPNPCQYAGSKFLAKACNDEFDYALRLRTGELIHFGTATIISNEFVLLHGIWQDMDSKKKPKKNELPYPAPRGVEVRISDIVWIMDAPNGS